MISFLRRHPAAIVLLLPAVLLPVSSGVTSALLVPALNSVRTLPPILEMMAAQGLIALLAAGGFYAARGRRPALDPENPLAPSEAPGFHGLWDLIVPLAVILLAVNRFYLTSVPWDVGPHRFFDELGLDAAYVERLFQGDVYFRDCVMLYNVLMFWPVHLLMTLFGHQLWVLQAWTLFLELAGLGAIFAALRFLTEDRRLSLLGLGLCVFLFYPDTPYPHASYSRYHLGLLPGLIAAWGMRRDSGLLRGAGGLAAAAYFHYTYDYGLVSGAALLAAFLLVFPKKLKSSVPVLAACFLPILLFFLWLGQARGGIGPALETVFYFPLHYHGSAVGWPFPDLWQDTLRAIARPGGESLRAWGLSQLAHGPYLIYGLAFLGIWFGPLSRARTDRKFLAVYLLAFAWGCAPKYIFRTGYILTGTHLYLAPAALLALWFAAEWGKYSDGISGGKTEPRLLSAWLMLVLSGYLYCHWDLNMTRRLASHPLLPGGKPAPAGYVPLDLPSARGIHVPEEWKSKLESAHAQIAAAMRNSRNVYVYPYDPLWYFLLEKKNASESDVTGDALPGGWASLFGSLAKSPPDFILLSNFARKPEPSPEMSLPLRKLLETAYVEEPTDGPIRLYRKADGR